MYSFTIEQLLERYPASPKREAASAIKYQKKFSLTLDNLKCLNPGCNNIRKWDVSGTKFNYCCSNTACNETTKKLRGKIRARNSSITYKQKTGYENPSHNPDVIQKIKDTYLIKTGYKNPSNNPEVRQKRRETYLVNTGYECPFSNPEVKQKIKETYLAKTGYENPSNNPKVRQIRNQTNLKKYGSTHFNNQHITNYTHWDDKQFWIDNFITKDNYFDYIKCMEYFNCLQPAAHNQIKKLGIDYTKIGGISLKEQALYPFLDSLNFIYETNVRNVIDGLELDIYLPELDLAIEYNGLYWHSYHEAIGTSPKQLDLNYMKYRHQAKSLACYNNGIRLLHIYEDTEDIENLILDFLNYEVNNKLEYELDSGCYPLGLQYQVIEPESRIVLGDRLLFNAGKITIIV